MKDNEILAELLIYLRKNTFYNKDVIQKYFPDIKQLSEGSTSREMFICKLAERGLILIKDQHLTLQELIEGGKNCV